MTYLNFVNNACGMDISFRLGAFYLPRLRSPKWGTPLRGFPRALFRAARRPRRLAGETTLRSDFGAYRTGCAQLLPSPPGSAGHITALPRPAVCKTRHSTAPKVPRRLRFCEISLGTHPSPRGEGSRRSPQGERPGDRVEPPLPSRGRGGRG